VPVVSDFLLSLSQVAFPHTSSWIEAFSESLIGLQRNSSRNAQKGKESLVGEKRESGITRPYAESIQPDSSFHPLLKLKPSCKLYLNPFFYSCMNNYLFTFFLVRCNKWNGNVTLWIPGGAGIIRTFPFKRNLQGKTLNGSLNEIKWRGWPLLKESAG